MRKLPATGKRIAVAGAGPVGLDFIYGKVEDGVLHPLDGQQHAHDGSPRVCHPHGPFGASSVPVAGYAALDLELELVSLDSRIRTPELLGRKPETVRDMAIADYIIVRENNILEEVMRRLEQGNQIGHRGSFDA